MRENEVIKNCNFACLEWMSKNLAFHLKGSMQIVGEISGSHGGVKATVFSFVASCSMVKFTEISEVLAASIMRVSSPFCQTTRRNNQGGSHFVRLFENRVSLLEVFRPEFCIHRNTGRWGVASRKGSEMTLSR
jgi:hypothetical protein